MHVFCNWNEHKIICLLRFLHGEMEQRALRNGLLGLIIWWQIQKLHAGGLFPKLAFVFLLKPIVLAHTRYHIFSRKHIIHMRCSFVYKAYDYSTSFLDLNVASKGEVLPSLLSLCLWWRLGCCLWCFWCPGRASWPWWCLALLCRCAGLCYILCCRILCCAFLRCGISLFCILSFSGSWIGFALRCTFSFWSIFFLGSDSSCLSDSISFIRFASFMSCWTYCSETSTALGKESGKRCWMSTGSSSCPFLVGALEMAACFAATLLSSRPLPLPRPRPLPLPFGFLLAPPSEPESSLNSLSGSSSSNCASLMDFRRRACAYDASSTKLNKRFASVTLTI